MDYKAIGFKAGLEIHQQLDTHKLFCQCQSSITEEAHYSFQRLLRPTQSEMGDVDRAALEESQRNKRFLYTASGTSTCLVEADEEPPHAANEEAIDLVLTMAKLLGAQPVDEIQFMRKIVIDGSNTTGFQRTALVAMNGSLKNVRISTLALEEDAARKLGEEGRVVQYGLDRLGIPLIEITTAADIKDPVHVHEVAEQLGMMLQSTKKVKRGLGTIRQDLNISIAHGARIEVKGIQSLRALSKVAENEVLRQKEILEMSETLQKRIPKSAFNHILSVEISSVFANTKSKLIQKQLQSKGCVKGIRLPGYHGLLKRQYSRLGKDMAVYAGLASGIGGIIHSDEMPGYGFSEQEIKVLKQRLQRDANDAFVLALGNETMVDAALSAVLRRAGMLYEGVPEEVRRSLPDNTTEYMRPLPGAARMYPETDVPPVRITKERVHALQLPEGVEEKRKRFISQYGLNEETVKQLLSCGMEDDFERMVKQFPDLKNVISRLYVNTFPELENEGIHTERINDAVLSQALSALQQGKYAKEALVDILKYVGSHPGVSINDAVQGCGLKVKGEQEIMQVIHKIVSEHTAFVEERGDDAHGPLMGIVMKELRGKADGKLISRTLHEEIQRVLSS